MSYSRTPKTPNSVYNAMLAAHIELLACKLRAFTTDDLWDAITHVSEPPESRVLGPAMLRALQRKLSPVEAQENPGLGESITPTTNVGPPVEIDYCALLYRGGWLLGKVAGG